MNTDTTQLTKETLAALLNGREYGNEITQDEERQAKAAGLVVVFGYSDDNVELRGCIHDEVGSWGGTTLTITSRGHLLSEDERLAQVQKGTDRDIEALWCKEPGYAWTYKTDIPHATFDIMEDGEKFCRGIVFALDDLK